MNNDCLITKLKSSVDNDNLLKLGETSLSLDGVGEIALRSSSNIVFYKDGVAQQPANVCVISGKEGVIHTITTYDKYKLTEVFSYRNPVLGKASINIDTLKYSYDMTALNVGENGITTGSVDSLANLTNLTNINLGSQSVLEGSISNLGKLTNLVSFSNEYGKLKGDVSVVESWSEQMTSFICQSPYLTGNISSFYNKPNLAILYLTNSKVEGDISLLSYKERLYLDNTNVSGSIEGYAVNLFNAGKKSGYMIVHAKGTNVTYNNHKLVESAYVARFEENRITISYNSTSQEIFAEYDGTSWTYYMQ